MLIERDNIINKYNILNLLYCIFPLAFLLGSSIVNIEVVLIIIAGFILYKKEVFKFDNLFVISTSVFFVYLIIITFIDLYPGFSSEYLSKSFLYLKNLLLLLVVSCSIKKGHFNYKYFLFSCLIITIFLSLDIIFQFYNGENIFGFESNIAHNSGLFGKEKIAGGYILRFFTLGIFSILLFLNKDNKTFSFLFTILTIIAIAGIIYSGNRMSFLLFYVFMFLSAILIKKIRFQTILCALVGILILTHSFSVNSYFKVRYVSFYQNAISIIPRVSKELQKKYPILSLNKDSNFIADYLSTGKNKEYKKNLLVQGSGHTIIYISSFEVMKDNVVFGQGIKAFQRKCSSKLYLPNRICERHPHNYYLEILIDTGIIGFILFMVMFYISLINKFFYFKNKKNRDLYYIFLMISLCIILEIFPLRSSGSFFSSVNSAYIFFLIGIFGGLREKFNN